MKTIPFAWVSERAQPALLALFTLLLLACSVVLLGLDRSLVTDVAPNGIVSFELARTEANSTAILQSWSSEARGIALFIQGLDSLYLFVYPAFFSLLASRQGRRLTGRWRSLGDSVAWIILLAIPLDAVENIALVRQLFNGATSADAFIAWSCAVPKFTLVLLVILYCLAAALTLTLRRIRS